MIKLPHKYVMDLFEAIAQGQTKVAAQNLLKPTAENIYHTGIYIGFVGLSFAMKEGKTKEDVLKDVSEALDNFIARKSFLEPQKPADVVYLDDVRTKKDSN